VEDEKDKPDKKRKRASGATSDIKSLEALTSARVVGTEFVTERLILGGLIEE
jgi:hypothetical protein